MKISKRNQIVIISIILFVSIFISISSEKENDKIIRQENNSYYEINSCEVSIFDFVLNNNQSIYQDHYYFRPNNNTPISCYGKIAGISVQTLGNETQFIISVGTSSILNLLIQSILWVVLLLFLPGDKKKIFDNNNSIKLIVFCSLLFTYSIYAENRFYEQNIYNFDFFNINSYLLIFLSFSFIYLILIEVISNRIYYFLNYLPFIFLTNFIYSGFNLSFLTLIIAFIGLHSLKKNALLNRLNIIYLILSIWWIFNSNSEYFFKVGKLRSFSNSSYDLFSNIYWILIFYLIINGVIHLYYLCRQYFNFTTFTNNISKASMGIIIFGLLGSNFPLLNFLSYYFFGFQRYVVDENNPIAFDQYSERISWRGVFPSSETIGEFFGACLLILLFYIARERKLSKLHVLGILSSSLGLYFSDNKTSIVLVFLLTLYYFYINSNFNDFKLSKNIFKLIIIIVGLAVLFVIIGADNLLSSYEYMSTTLYLRASSYQISSTPSTSLNFILFSIDNNLFFKYFFGLISSIAFLLNRSIMWGLFFARYNPNIYEAFFGTGPLSFGKLYGELQIKDFEGVLLPHSSVLSFITFFGVFPIILIALNFFFKVYSKRKNSEYLIFALYFTINILKNDSLNYLPMFLFYFLMIKLISNKLLKLN